MLGRWLAVSNPGFSPRTMKKMRKLVFDNIETWNYSCKNLLFLLQDFVEHIRAFRVGIDESNIWSVL